MLVKKQKKRELRLNIGCGSNKISGYVNIDAEKTCKPDILLDITRNLLPYKIGTVDEILFFHSIEHISKALHRPVLLEFARVLKPCAKLIISYPNFWECAKRWFKNTNGQRTFWEATLYGRQLYPGDFHVCAMNPDELTSMLYECGFKNVKSFPEPIEVFNTVTTCIKNPNGPIPTYETVIANDMKNMLVVKGAA
jgi:SAM-dependent methyltransferase